MTRQVFTVVDPQTVPDSSLSMRSMSSVRAGSKDRKPCNRSGYYARWEAQTMASCLTMTTRMAGKPTLHMRLLRN
jgi:hypothetical protein